MAGPFEFVLSRCVRRGVLAACAPRRGRGPANASLGSPAHAHIQRFACELHARPGSAVPKMQTTSAATPYFQCFSPRRSAMWAPHHPEP